MKAALFYKNEWNLLFKVNRILPMITGQSGAASVYGGLFQDWHHKLITNIMGKDLWGDKQ